MKKVVLAYSGGLDTSICIPLLKEHYGYDELIAVIVDVGQPEEDLKAATERGEELSDLYKLIDAKAEFVQDYIFPLIKANGNYEGYVLGTAIARPLIAKKVVEVAKGEDADAVAHGCTGKGNDQLRFDAVFRTSGLEVIAPVREMSLTREEEKLYASEHGICRSIEGSELEDPSFFPPEEIYKWTSSVANASKEAAIMEIGFEYGVPVSLNGTEMDGISLIKKLNDVGGKHGVGRTDMIEDRVLGFKSREIYEHPAATILLEAHRDLEQLVLTRHELRFKDFVDRTWSELVYQGLVMDPLFEGLNAFVDKTQGRVNGTVHMKLEKGAARVIGRESPNALYTKDVSFDVKQEQRGAEGFSLYHGFQSSVFRKRYSD
jgi:argininosuccinate synthase